MCAEMATELLAPPTRAETQDDYDRAAWDYIDWLRDKTPEQARAHFAKVAWIESYDGVPATRCPKCGDAVLELKWSKDRTEWQCLEATCRNRWEWKAR